MLYICGDSPQTLQTLTRTDLTDQKRIRKVWLFEITCQPSWKELKEIQKSKNKSSIFNHHCKEKYFHKSLHYYITWLWTLKKKRFNAMKAILIPKGTKENFRPKTELNAKILTFSKLLKYDT